MPSHLPMAVSSGTATVVSAALGGMTAAPGKWIVGLLVRRKRASVGEYPCLDFDCVVWGLVLNCIYICAFDGKLV